MAVAVATVGHQVVSAILTHNFVTGYDFSNHAVDQALTKGTANLVTEYVDLIAGLTLAMGMFLTMLGAMRVGLIGVGWPTSGCSARSSSSCPSAARSSR